MIEIDSLSELNEALKLGQQERILSGVVDVEFLPDEPIDLEPEEPEADLEFKVATIALNLERAATIEQDYLICGLLDDGWQIDDKIICPPFVTLIFSREKEEVKE